MRISKYFPIVGVGMDSHGALPPIIPPPPPAGPNPAPNPQVKWIHMIIQPWMAQVTGKWSMDSVQTEGMGDILWQYDWGPGQPHVPIGPPLLSPSIATLLLGSTCKYWMASHAITEQVDGGALAGLSGGGAAVAVSLPIFIISGEDCWDTACALSYVLPTSIVTQMVSTRWVGFNFADLFASALALAGDAAAALIMSKLGGKLIPGNWDDQILGGLASTFMMHAGTLLGSLPTELFITGEASALGLAAIFETTAPLVALAPLASFLAGKGGTWIGETWGSDEHGVVEEPAPASDFDPPPPDGSTPDAGPGDAGAPAGDTGDAGVPAGGFGDGGAPDSGAGTDGAHGAGPQGPDGSDGPGGSGGSSGDGGAGGSGSQPE